MPCIQSQEHKLTQTWGLSSWRFFISGQKYLSQPPLPRSLCSSHWGEFSFRTTSNYKKIPDLWSLCTGGEIMEERVSNQPTPLATACCSRLWCFYGHQSVDQRSSKHSLKTHFQESLLKYRFLGPTQDHRLPRDIEAADPWTELQVPLTQ